MSLKLSKTAIRELTKLYRAVLIGAIVATAFASSGAMAETTWGNHKDEKAGTKGTATIFNESDGGGSMFTNNDGTVSYVGVNDGGASGIDAQIYAKNSKTNVGTRLNVTTGGMYYTTGKTDGSYEDEDEIATLGTTANGTYSSTATYATGTIGAALQDLVGTAQATGTDAIAMGDGSTVSGEDSIAIGTGSTVSGEDSIAIGNGNTVTGNNSFAIGSGLKVSTDNTIALGTDAETVDVAGTLDTAKLKLAGTEVTATATELNVLHGITATTAELNILDGVTATKDELNVLDGITATTAELNILDGVTATATELNVLDGITATTAELNYMDGVTSNVQTQLDAKANLTGGNSFTGDQTIAGDLTVSGTSTFNGNTVIGDANSDTLTVKSASTFKEQINAEAGIKDGNTYLQEGILYVKGNTGADVSTLTATELKTTKVSVGGNSTSLADNLLTLNNGTNTTTLKAISAGLEVTTGMKVDGALDIGSTGKGFDANGNAKTGTLTVGAANAITGSANKLDMGNNSLTAIKDISSTALTTNDSAKTVAIGGSGYTTTVTGNEVVTGTLQIGGTSGATLSSNSTSLSVNKKFVVTDGGADITGNTLVKGTFGAGTNGTEFAVDGSGNTDIAGSLKVGSANQFQVTNTGAVSTTSTLTADGESKFGKNGTTYALDVTADAVTANKVVEAKSGVKFGTDTIAMTGVERGAVAAKAAESNDAKVASAAAVQNTRAAINTDVNAVLGGVYKIDATEKTVSYDNTAIAGINGFESGATSLTDALKKYADNVQVATGVAFDAAGSNTTTYTKKASVDYDGLNTGSSLKTAIEQLDTNIGTAISGAASRTTGAVAANATVNANLKALDTAIGSDADLKAVDKSGASVDGVNGVTNANTINANLTALNNTIGDITALSASTGTATDPEDRVGDALTKGTGTQPTTVVQALNNIDATLGNIHGLKSETSNLKAVSNLADGTTVEQHLVALDDAIGNRQNYTLSNHISNNQTIAASLDGLDVGLANLEDDVNKMGREMKSGFASLAALSGLVPNARSAGDTQLSIGTGYYRGTTGFALGAFHHVNDNVLLNLGGAYGGNGAATFRGGVTFGF